VLVALLWIWERLSDGVGLCLMLVDEPAGGYEGCRSVLGVAEALTFDVVLTETTSTCSSLD